ncbi:MULTISPECIES: FecR family protein [Butyricimonas]|uniref:FecR family protein n=1 Tax=Butyricimonas TaxID=574697 RepID=UPI002081454A|nr:FecR family protein [Butyricimonas paravirosa]BDF53800.1 iron dicitrate transporter FecR [Odoribacteraceae bacterium]GKH92739.1 iron dicitrate transporter FecR [Odoribacteraceae bacterium]GKI00439.1 iron dicitrate transporter FecR [Odoribacteraceae bacterium]GKI04966.1 iron dicitrate transporter FecR [Odoribacteraceae bacterium]
MLSKEEHIARLIFLHVQGMTDNAQEKELNEWRSVSPRHEELFQRMLSSEHVEKSISRFVKTEEEEERGWRQLQQKARSGRSVRKIKWFPYAAAIVLILSVGGVFYFSGDKEQTEILPIAKNEVQVPGSRAVLILPDGRKVDLENEVLRSDLAQSDSLLLVSARSLKYRDIDSPDTTEIFHTLEIPRGGEYLLTLSDGTMIYLNSESTLSFPVKFQGKERKVYLTGEAYFKVAKNTEHPFVVTAGELEVLVTGTTFGVRAYKDEKDIQTTLESGQVTVRVEGKSVKLVPNKQVLFNKSTMGLEVRDVDVDLYLAWADGRLVYDNCPLEKILTDLGRWYNIDVFYSRDELRSYQFSLNMKKHEEFTQVLELIGKTGEVQFEIKDNTVIVK